MAKARRFFIVLTLMLSGMTAAFSQSYNAGFFVGPAFCQVDGDLYAGYNQLGFTAGFFANRPYGKYLMGQMELKYSLYGAHSSVKEVNEHNYNPYSLRLHYAEIPLMLRYNLGHFTVGGKSLDFITLEAGASLDFCLRAFEDVDGDFQETTDRWRFFSMTGNGGAHFAITDHWGVGARFMYSILPCRVSGAPGYSHYRYHNKVIQLTLTYTIFSPLR